MEEEELIDISSCEIGIRSNTLLPDEITAILGLTPDRFHAKGDTWVVKKTGSVGTRPWTVWAISTPRIEMTDDNLGVHIDHLRQRLDGKVPILQALKNDKRIDEVSAWFWTETNDAGVGPDLLAPDMEFLMSFCHRIHLSVIVRSEPWLQNEGQPQGQ